MSEMNNVSEKSRLSKTSHTVKISTRELCAIAWSSPGAMREQVSGPHSTAVLQRFKVEMPGISKART